MKKCFLIVTSFFIANICFSQADLEFQKIAFFPEVIKSEHIGEVAGRKLEAKLDNIILQATGGSSNKRRFVLFGKVDLTDEMILESSPPLHKVVFNIQLIIGDVVEKRKYGILNFENCIGVNKIKDRAIIQAMSKIRANSKTEKFINEAKEKIVSYYSNNCKFIITEASTLAEQKKYNKSVEKLMNVPKISEDCFFMAQTKIIEIYKQKELYNLENPTSKKDSIIETIEEERIDYSWLKPKSSTNKIDESVGEKTEKKSNNEENSIEETKNNE